ncbi:MAG: peptidase M22 [Faecalibacterium sp.]|nr:peptidase M22 [Ruminococcus sp.]MCM1392726.1 peptidase M22 [Ruminococcus sp.]MCM1485196.1 peptidase M22 [Faecalibacterium sp.]
MMAYIGFDTSNYTTSVAVYYPDENKISHCKKLLPVKKGEKGLRQSDAVFHHTVQLQEICNQLFKDNDIKTDAIAVSAYPRLAEGSYMPCFLVGKNTASCISSVMNVPLYLTSHQHGHILAALYSANRLDLIDSRFIAFHLSGGTTEAVLVEPDEENIFSCTLVAKSLDLKAGQAVDRVGLMLDLSFPCGSALEKLALNSRKTFKIKPSIKDGNCSLSGVENKCKKMIEQGEPQEDIAAYCLAYISASLESMTDGLLSRYGSLQLVYAGGVMSNSIIREHFTKKYSAVFADPEFSADNAAGVAIAAYLKHKK